QPDRFTDDAATFQANVDAVANPGNGGTPYLATLSFVDSELSADMRQDPAKSRRSRYVIIFLSDGEPTDGSTDDERLGVVDQIMQHANQMSAGVTLNTVYLGGNNPVAEAALIAMSTRGHGIHKSFPNGD